MVYHKIIHGALRKHTLCVQIRKCINLRIEWYIISLFPIQMLRIKELNGLKIVRDQNCGPTLSFNNFQLIIGDHPGEKNYNEWGLCLLLLCWLTYEQQSNTVVGGHIVCHCFNTILPLSLSPPCRTKIVSNKLTYEQQSNSGRRLQRFCR